MPADPLLSRRVRVYWADDKRFYGGKITTAVGDKHTVCHDDGEVVHYRLSEEVWFEERDRSEDTPLHLCDESPTCAAPSRSSLSTSDLPAQPLPATRSAIASPALIGPRRIAAATNASTIGSASRRPSRTACASGPTRRGGKQRALPRPSRPPHTARGRSRRR
eukprot:7132528-Prymnesium_polylepis.1